MPISSQTFVRTTIGLMLVGLFALLAIVGTTIWLVDRTQTYFDEVVEAREARTAAVDLRTAMQDIETGQRGFLLTGNESYLEPYNTALGTVLPRYETLREILIPYPQAAEPLARLREGIDIKLDEMARTIELTRAGQRDEALAIVNTDQGKALMDEARLFFDALIRAADERLTVGVSDQRANALALRWAALIGAVVIVLVAGGSAVIAMRYTRELAKARSEVEALNQGLEERVKERTAELGRANEEIQRFAYIVTHDLRAPLVNIMGFTSELEASVAPLQALATRADADDQDPEIQAARLAANEDLPEAINFIRSSTKKMDGLINAILKLSREGRRPLRPERIELQSMLGATAAAIQHQVSENEGEIAIDADVPPVYSDRLALEQIFGNLMDNAVKYRDPKRPLRLKIDAKQALGNRVIIEFADNGRGIAPQDHERVFELFRRSGTQDQAGEGIGLAHVRGIVRNLGGEITLQSVLGEGTTFRVSLPRDLRAVVRSTTN